MSSPYEAYRRQHPDWDGEYAHEGASLEVTTAGGVEEIVRDAVAKLAGINDSMMVTITAGGSGSWSWDGSDLRHVPARKAELVKLRYFAGLTIEQAAEVLGVAVPTAKRDWTYARAWLFKEISRNRQG